MILFSSTGIELTREQKMEGVLFTPAMCSKQCMAFCWAIYTNQLSIPLTDFLDLRFRVAMKKKE